MRRRAAAALAVLAIAFLAEPAEATVYFASGFDLCTSPVSAGGTYGWSVVGSPLVTTTVESGFGNLCALRIAPARNAQQYIAPPSWSSASSLRLSCRITPTATGNGSCTREVASLVGSGGDWSGKAAVLSMHAASATQVTLQAYYGSQTQKVCSGSPHLGKQCTTAADCPEIHPGEAQCAITALASSPVMTLGTTYEFTLTQDNGSGATAGTVTLGLYEGSAGSAPAVYSRGAASRIVGECSGGTNDLAPCNASTECPSGSCVVSNVVAPTTVRLGASDTSNCAPSFVLDSCWVYDGTVVQNWRAETLLPASGVGTDQDWSVTGAANAGLAIGDGATPDGDTRYIEKANGSGTAPLAIDVPLSNPSTPLPTPVVAVAFEALAKDNENTASRTMDVRLDATDGTNRANGTHATTVDWNDQGASASYYAITPETYVLAPDGSAFSQADLDALQISVNRSATTHTTNSVRVTSAAALVIAQTADPPVPTNIRDRDQDGEDTVCFVGDSTWDNVDFQNAVVANLVEPTNIYFYTRGGSQIGDAAAEWLQLIEGTSSTYLGLTVARGVAGRTCDVILISHLANFATAGLSLVDPKLPTSLLGVAQPGYCEHQGGANQGNACWCSATEPKTSNIGATPAPNTTPAVYRCVNSGNWRGTPVAVGGIFGFCPCANNADCTYGRRTPGPLHTPGVCVTASPQAYCQLHVGNPAPDAPPSTRDTWIAPGCLDGANCAGGICVRKPPIADLEQVVADINAATAARPTPNPAATPAGASGAPIVIWVAAPQAFRGDLTSGFGWDQTYPRFDRAREVYRRQTYFVDLHARFRQRFTDQKCATSNACTDDEDSTLGLRDYVHWTSAGQLEAATTLATCLSSGGADGVCAGGTCTAGLVGDACSANADCDLRRCP